MLRYYFRASGDNARCVKTDIPCAVCYCIALHGGSARITCRKSAATVVLCDAIRVSVYTHDIAYFIPVVCPNLTFSPTVPGRQENFESLLFLLVVLGVFCLPGTVGERARGSTTSRDCRTSLVASIRAEAPMTALQVHFMDRI